MKKNYKILIFIFLIAIIFRLYFVLQVNSYSSDEAYFHLRNMKYINEKYIPMLYDELGYGGRYVLAPYLYYYLLFPFYLISEKIAFKIMPEIIFSLVVFIVYFFSYKLTKNRGVSLIASFISAFIPFYIKETINSVNFSYLTALLIILASYSLLNLEKKLHFAFFILFSFILPILSPLNFILPLSLLFYIFFLFLEAKKETKLKKEAIIFSIFLLVLINFLLFKKIFLNMGIEALWQNTPKELLKEYFKGINIINAVYNISAIPLIFGVVGLLYGLTKERTKEFYMVCGLLSGSFLLMLLKLVKFNVGIFMLSILLTIVSSETFKAIVSYIKLTKFAAYKKFFVVLLILLIFGTLIYPSCLSAKNKISLAYKEKEIEAANWLAKNTEENSTVLAGIEEGHMITYFSERKNVIDSEFLLSPDRYGDVTKMLSTQSLVEAVELLRKYDVDYFYLSKRTIEKYKKPNYIQDENCFKKVYKNEEVEIYKVLC